MSRRRPQHDVLALDALGGLGPAPGPAPMPLQPPQPLQPLQQVQANTFGARLAGLGGFGGLGGPAAQKAMNGHGRVTRCCAPSPAECLRVFNSNNNGKDPSLISLDDLRDAVRVLCNNEACTQGQYMHRECFDQFEASVLTYLKSCGRARSWSERQRVQNLWTKKGYDLAYKACGCRCARGHLRKDLDWSPPAQPANVRDEDAGAKKKKRRNKNNARPVLALGGAGHYKNDTNNNFGAEPRGRAGSLSSGSTGSSPPSGSLLSHAVMQGPQPGGTPSGRGRKGPGAAGANKQPDFFSERHNGAGGNGIFARRLDFSSFNVLPKMKLNSYQVKMEDEGNHGNDETRCFILSTLAANQQNRAACLLCGTLMAVFDRYPLVDGSFFLTPKKHSAACLPTKVEGKTQFLSAVCMGCMDNKRTMCRFCRTPWDGSSLVLGTMYSYDIFAAVPCCQERSKCNSCKKPLLSTFQRLNFYSDYSQDVACPHCGVSDHHFIKSLASTYQMQP